MRPWITLALLAVAAPAAAETINFEEIPPANMECCYLTEEYAHLGIHFLTRDDGAIFEGISRGDPADWRVEGTNGSAFLGMNGNSYVIRAQFDEPIVGFAFDAARGNGSSGPSVVTVEGYFEDGRVERINVPLGPVNDWVRIELAEVVDFVRILNTGTDPNPNFAIDNMSWSVAQEEPELVEVPIDIRPFFKNNVVIVDGWGMISVALFGSEELPVWDVDADTLAFGPAGAARAHVNGPHYVDLNWDRQLDMLLHFRTSETGVAAGDEQMCLTGALVDGTPIQGCDAVSAMTKADWWSWWWNWWQSLIGGSDDDGDKPDPEPKKKKKKHHHH